MIKLIFVSMQTISGQIVDVVNNKIFPGEVVFEGKIPQHRHGYNLTKDIKKVNSSNKGKIVEIRRLKKAPAQLIMPGLVDAHIHIESSILVPSRFAEIAITHGTIGVVCDPHEIGNVLGLRGIEYMTRDGKKSPLKFGWTVPSCIPATDLDISGARLDHDEVSKLLKRPNFVGLSEMMNYPGVLQEDREVTTKISTAKKYHKPIDGHAPLLSGADLKKYVEAGITSDHECTNAREAEEKIKLGMKIWVREGSAAKNLDALLPILKKYPDMCALCSDDLHPHDLIKGHINLLVKRLIAEGMDPIQVIKIASYNPIQHYHLPIGQLQVGDTADFVVVDDWQNFQTLQTWINGKLVAKNGKALFSPTPRKIKNNFKIKFKKLSDIALQDKPNTQISIKVIKAIDGQLLTGEEIAELQVDARGYINPDIKQDILKIVVAERYGNNFIGVGLVRNFGLKSGAIASSVAHDSHHIIAVGTNDKDLVIAINELIKIRGGVICIKKGKVHNKINLTIGGIMSTRHGRIIAKKYKKLLKNTQKLGTSLRDPFMTMSFMALRVIPELKLTEKGLFDAKRWDYVDLKMK